MNQVELLKLAYRRTFNTEDGQRVLADMKARFNYESTTFIPNDPHNSAFLEGQRAALLKVIGMLSEAKEPNK